MIKAVTVLLLAVLITGCAVNKPIPVEYRGHISTGLSVTNHNSVGVTKWQDKRAISGINEKLVSLGIISKEITIEGTKVRIADFVRDNFIKELKAQGVNVKEIDILPASSDKQTLKNIAVNNNVNFILSSDLISFDVGFHGLWTLECSRKVAISITIIDENGNHIMLRELFDASMVNNEGMGILYSTMLDQITNKVMKDALEKAIIKTIKVLNKA